MSYDDLILSHYQKVAAHNGLSSSSTMEDPYIRKCETDFFLKEVGRFVDLVNESPKIFEVGCGNGHLLSELREKFSSAALSAIEFTPELLNQAASRLLDNTKISHGDARDASFFPKEQDIVISERVVINLLERRDQYAAFKNIADSLRVGGIYIMAESFFEPLVELNRARREMKLDPIEVSKQNRYLTEDMLKKLEFMGLKEITPSVDKNYLSTHFFLSRVLYWLVKPDGVKLGSNCVVEFFDRALPSSVGNYSPILFRVFKKIDNPPTPREFYSKK